MMLLCVFCPKRKGAEEGQTSAHFHIRNYKLRFIVLQKQKTKIYSLITFGGIYSSSRQKIKTIISSTLDLAVRTPMLQCIRSDVIITCSHFSADLISLLIRRL